MLKALDIIETNTGINIKSTYFVLSVPMYNRKAQCLYVVIEFYRRSSFDFFFVLFVFESLGDEYKFLES